MTSINRIRKGIRPSTVRPAKGTSPSSPACFVTVRPILIFVYLSFSINCTVDCTVTCDQDSVNIVFLFTLNFNPYIRGIGKYMMLDDVLFLSIDWLIANLFFLSGADPYLCSKSGIYPIDSAIAAGNVRVQYIQYSDLLLKHGYLHRFIKNRLRDLLRHICVVPWRMLLKIRVDKSYFLPARSSLCLVGIFRLDDMYSLYVYVRFTVCNKYYNTFTCKPTVLRIW